MSVYCKYSEPTVYFTEKLTKLLEVEGRVLVGIDMSWSLK